MNTKQKLHKAYLSKWSALFKEQADSGLTIKDWCFQNDISIYKYNYWKHALKEAYVDTVLPDIVPISVPAASIQSPDMSLPSSCDSRDLSEAPDISIVINGCRISFPSSTPDDTVFRIFKAVRHA